MEPKPVEQTRRPGYPTRREMLAGAASFVLVNVAGIHVAFAEAALDGLHVAPIFEHGTGRGATGCVVVSPPVFLSEEQALQVIREELARHGIELKGADVVLEGVRIPQRFRNYESEETDERDLGRDALIGWKRAKPLKVDGLDSQRRIAVEFVSKRHYYELGGVQESYGSHALDHADPSEFRGWYSSAQSYDFKGTAEFVAEQVKEQDTQPIFLGVFYDPQREPAAKKGETTLREALQMPKKTLEERKEDSKKLLRQQAQDFVAWLKKEKAIP